MIARPAAYADQLRRPRVDAAGTAKARACDGAPKKMKPRREHVRMVMQNIAENQFDSSAAKLV